jgi:hypothetical protein
LPNSASSAAREASISAVFGRDVRPHLWLVVVAEIRRRLVALLFGRRLTAMLGDARVVLDAHAAHVQFGMTDLALVEPAQRQRQRFE